VLIAQRILHDPGEQRSKMLLVVHLDARAVPEELHHRVLHVVASFPLLSEQRAKPPAHPFMNPFEIPLKQRGERFLISAMQLFQIVGGIVDLLFHKERCIYSKNEKSSEHHNHDPSRFRPAGPSSGNGAGLRAVRQGPPSLPVAPDHGKSAPRPKEGRREARPAIRNHIAQH